MRRSVVPLVLAGVLGAAPLVMPAEAQSPRDPSSVSVPVYRPPLRGAPGGRVGGGTRSAAARETFVLTALVPDHPAYTTREQPTLHWFISRGTSLPVEVTVVDPRAVKPVLETRLDAPVGAGAQRFRLADHGIRLEPGVPYRWFVAVISDPGRRSRDIVTGGIVERVATPDAVTRRLPTAGPAELPFLYAEHGLWYDALDTLTELIDRAPDDEGLRRQRAALLSQVGLPPIDAR